MDVQWTLSELVAEAAASIATLPTPKNGQVRAVPDERTVRYYGTLGLLDRPVATRGRTALYSRKHLAQVVAIKRLQSAGRSLADIQGLWPTLDEVTLARMSGIELAPKGRATRREFWKRDAAPAAPSGSRGGSSAGPDEPERPRSGQPGSSAGPDAPERRSGQPDRPGHVPGRSKPGRSEQPDRPGHVPGRSMPGRSGQPGTPPGGPIPGAPHDPVPGQPEPMPEPEIPAWPGRPDPGQPEPEPMPEPEIPAWPGRPDPGQPEPGPAPEPEPWPGYPDVPQVPAPARPIPGWPEYPVPGRPAPGQPPSERGRTAPVIGVVVPAPGVPVHRARGTQTVGGQAPGGAEAQVGYAPVELRVELVPGSNIVLVVGLADDVTHTIHPADVRAIRAAAAPLVAELARRGLIARDADDAGTLEET